MIGFTVYRKRVGFRSTFADQPLNTSKLPAFRAEHFPYSGPYPWLDLPDALDRINDKLKCGELSEEEAAQCRNWSDNGYIIIRNLIENQVLDDVWGAYEEAIRKGKIKPPKEAANQADPWPGRSLNPHRKMGELCKILKHAALHRWLYILTERQPKTLQTIASHKGYYPGSHRLPYVFSKDVGIAESALETDGYVPYHEKYEPYIRRLIEEHGIEPHYFHARKGDVLIWHANLLHGGSLRHDMQLSRRALVCHFFVKGSFVYHDLAASSSKQQYLGTCLLRKWT